MDGGQLFRQACIATFKDKYWFFERIKGSIFHYVYLDEVVIKNSLPLSHTLRGVVLEFVTKNGSLKGYSIGRHVFTDKEIISGYVHSHSSTVTNFRDHSFMSFCVGSYRPKSEFADIESLLDAKMFLGGFLNYLRYEDLDGGPYLRINELGTIKNDTSDLINGFVEDVSSFLRSESFTDYSKLSTTFDGEKFHVNFNDFLHDYFVKFYLEKHCIDVYPISQNPNGGYIDINASDNTLQNKDVPENIILGGQTFPFLVLETEKERDGNNYNPVIPDRVKEFIIKFLENKLNNYLYENFTRIKRCKGQINSKFDSYKQDKTALV